MNIISKMIESYRDIFVVVPLLLEILTWKQQVFAEASFKTFWALQKTQKELSERVQPQGGKSIKYEILK